LIAAAHHALLGLALAALADASLRVATLTGARGLDRAIAALPLAAAFAVAEALVLGLVGLGTDPLALAAGTGLAWLLVRSWLGPLAPRPLRELGVWWRGLAPAGRAGAGAAAGALLVYSAWALRYPALGYDGLAHYLPTVAGWVREGSPGTATDYWDAYPTGSYPLTDQVLLSWSVGISRSLVSITLWSVAAFAMLAVAGWRGLALLGVSGPAAGLATAALVSGPLVAGQLNGFYTDLPALAWLAVAAALCAASPARPALLAPAIVAAGLAIGTKTTPLLAALAALAVAAFVARRDLRSLAGPLALAALVALLVGGTWFVRNLIVHGSPLWPFVAGPLGDPVPPALRALDGRLISDLGSIGARAGEYADLAAGGILVLAGAVLAPALARRREVVLAAGVAVLCALAWASAPYTGFPSAERFDIIAVAALRYLLPGLGAATLAVALATRRPGAGGAAALAVLAVAGVWNVERSAALGFPFVPSAGSLAVGAIGGALAALAAPALPGALGGAPRGLARAPLGLARAPRGLARAAIPVVAAVAAAALALPASGYVDRHMRIEQSAVGYALWIAAREGSSGGGRPVSAVATVNGALVGDELRRPVGLLPRDESCASLRLRVRSEWVALPRLVPERLTGGSGRLAALRRCLAGVAPAYRDPLYTLHGPR
jgi:hypothetical protein